MQQNLANFDPIDDLDDNYKEKSLKANKCVITIGVILLCVIGAAFYCEIEYNSDSERNILISTVLPNNKVIKNILDNKTYEISTINNKLRLVLVQDDSQIESKVKMKFIHDCSITSLNSHLNALAHSDMHDLATFIANSKGKLEFEDSHLYSVMSITVPKEKLSYSLFFLFDMLKNLEESVNQDSLSIISAESNEAKKEKVKRGFQAIKTVKSTSFELKMPKMNWENSQGKEITIEFPINSAKPFTHEVDFLVYSVVSNLNLVHSDFYMSEYKNIECSADYQSETTAMLKIKIELRPEDSVNLALSAFFSTLRCYIMCDATLIQNYLNMVEVMKLSDENKAESILKVPNIEERNVSTFFSNTKSSCKAIQDSIYSLSAENALVSVKSDEESFKRIKLDVSKAEGPCLRRIPFENNQYSEFDSRTVHNEFLNQSCFNGNRREVNSFVAVFKNNCKLVRKLASETKFGVEKDSFAFQVLVRLVARRLKTELFKYSQIGEYFKLIHFKGRVSLKLSGNTENVVEMHLNLVRELFTVVVLRDFDENEFDGAFEATKRQVLGFDENEVEELNFASLIDFCKEITKFLMVSAEFKGSLSEEELVKITDFTERLQFKPYLGEKGMFTRDEIVLLNYLTGLEDCLMDELEGKFSLECDKKRFRNIYGRLREESDLKSIAEKAVLEVKSKETRFREAALFYFTVNGDINIDSSLGKEVIKEKLENKISLAIHNN